jgi:hypothetical protein
MPVVGSNLDLLELGEVDEHPAVADARRRPAVGA